MEISVARKRLEEMRADLDKTLSVLAGEHHLVRGGGAEAGDAGANLTEADRNAASMQAALAQRAEVLAALSRMDDGSYGRCVDCAGPVPEPRLEARPATARCVPCQSKRPPSPIMGAPPPWDSNHKALTSAAARGVAGFATPAHGNHRVVTATTVWGTASSLRRPHRRGTGGAQPPVIGGCRGRPPTVTA